MPFHEKLEKCPNCRSMNIKFVKTIGEGANTIGKDILDIYVCMDCRKELFKGKCVKKGFWTTIFPRENDRTIDDHYAFYGQKAPY